ncbi:hypothetical protein [Paraburkholderia gardini]|uniref:hypothetical protein n=1 Tax=Paraburkholderia gardini TaxID=2823469 RepID=UPI001D460420|nr:hypothetical protein [Paraburkholderia gardini]CAG4913893.1 hypothetical protein R69919_04142 [Paraburkholderia gardini]
MYTTLVQNFKDAQVAAAVAYLNVCAAEATVFPAASQHYRATQVRSEYSSKRELADFCARLSHVLVQEATRRFSPPGGRMEIDEARELKNASVDIHGALDAGKCPDFDAFWAHLERTFSGDAGQRVAYVQAAKALINGFGLKPDSDIKRTSSAIVLDARIWSEPVFRSSSRKATYHSQQTAAGVITGLATFASQAGYGALGSELSHGRLVDYEFTTREKVSLHGLDIVMFNEKWQFKFAHEVGDALSLFISEYGAEYLATRDRY